MSDDAIVLLAVTHYAPGVPRGWVAWKPRGGGELPKLRPNTRVAVKLINDREFSETNNCRKFEEYSWNPNSITHYKVLK